MRNFKTLGRRIPCSISKYLFGDRKKFAIKVELNDIDWKLWEETYARFYDENQMVLVGKIVNDAGYKIMGEVDLSSKKVLELGPGKINPDKIICWEHPNFSDKMLNNLQSMFSVDKIQFWLLKIKSLDVNLLVKFKFKKI